MSVGNAELHTKKNSVGWKQKKYVYLDEKEHEALCKRYDEGTIKPTSKEKLIVNPRIAFKVSDNDIVSNIPYHWVKERKDQYGIISSVSLQNPVKNLLWDYFYFANSDVFRPAAIAFEKSEANTLGTRIKATYTNHVKGTKAYSDFWEEEFRRITNGYEPIVDGKPCGIRISGEFYFYLNYTRINKIKMMDDGTDKALEAFPDFLVMDYYYYKELEAREHPTKFNLDPTYRRSMVLAKSRRKGMSFKAAAGCVWIVAFNNNVRVGIASEAHSTDDTDAVKCAKKCLPIIDWISNYTPFGRKVVGDPKNNGGWKHEVPKITRNQFSLTLGLFNTKTKEKAGRQSTIFTMTMTKDDAASGEGLHRLYFEEAGKIANLDKAWVFSRETLKAGSLFKGIAIIFGTGGEMVSSSGKDGSSKAFRNLFYGPQYGELAEFENIYEYKPNLKPCGYFICDMWSNFGSYIVHEGSRVSGLDKMGNAIFWIAELHLNKERLLKQNGPRRDFNKFLTQRCKTPSEAFLVGEGSVFNVTDLLVRRNTIKNSRGSFDKLRTPGELYENSDGTIGFKPDLERKFVPLTSTSYDKNERDGCLLIYEHPRDVYGSIPDDAYIITVDPIGKDTDGGESLNAVIVLKTPKYSQHIGRERIVATYIGRFQTKPLTFLHKILYKLSKFYNAQITYENDQDGGILNYFASRNMLDRLMESPRMVTKKHIPNSKTLKRDYGHSMASDRHKSFGEQYLNEWLDYRHPGKTSLDENGEAVREDGVRNLDLLEDEFIIEELINYTRAGNYDSVLALMGGIIQFQERYLDPDINAVHKLHAEKISEELMEYYFERFDDSAGYQQWKSEKHNYKIL